VHIRRPVLRGLCFNAVGACILGCFALASCASGSNDPETSDFGDSAIPPPTTTEDSGTPGNVDPDSGSPSSSEDSGSGSIPDATTSTDRDAAFAVDSTAPSNPHDSAAPIDSAGPDTNVPDTAAPDTGTTAKDSGSASCDGLPQWVSGTTASEVQNLGEKYTCIVEGWCSLTGSSAVLAYEPGTGSAWQEAWEDSGPCN
jgi:hypothetical protein